MPQPRMTRMATKYGLNGTGAMATNQSGLDHIILAIRVKHHTHGMKIDKEFQIGSTIIIYVEADRRVRRIQNRDVNQVIISGGQSRVKK